MNPLKRKHAIHDISIAPHYYSVVHGVGMPPETRGSDSRVKEPPSLPELHHETLILDDESVVMDWWEHPWVEEIGVTDGDLDCPYQVWLEKFAPSIPTGTLRLDLRDADPNAAIPEDVSIVPYGDGWAIRSCRGDYWCELIPNGWSDMPNDWFDALTFKTQEAAKAAFTLASVAYAEREERQKAAYAVLGIEDR